MKGRTPPGTVLYAVGDIHGRIDLLTQMQERIATDASQRSSRRKLVVYLGDFVSRGAYSREVIDRVSTWQPPGISTISLKGNHEDLLLRFLDGEIDTGRHWFDYGGLQTLSSYGVSISDSKALSDEDMAMLRNKFAAALPESHLKFYRSLRISYQAGNYYFVHGGIKPGIPLPQQSAHDCMWIRKAFLDSDANHGAIVIHGHSISPQPVVRHNRIGIDTGAYQSGMLTCLVLAGTSQSFLQACAADLSAPLQIV